MNLTKIEWVENPDGTQGYTWNPITGCLNHTPEGLCLGGMFPCYAFKLANGRLRSRYLANYAIATPDVDHPVELKAEWYDDPFHPRFWEDRLEPVGLTGGNKRPHSYGHLTCCKVHKPKGIFVCDMSDLFGIGIPQEWTQRVMDTIKKCPDHRFYLLTKQPQNLSKFSPFPDNCWVGVTATNQHQFNIALAWLAQIEASLTFISVEPHLERIQVKASDLRGLGFKLGWLIDGAQTNPYKPPKLAWVEEIIFACVKANIPYFLKDNLGDIIPGYQSGDKLRQEMPKNLNPAIDK